MVSPFLEMEKEQKSCSNQCYYMCSYVGFLIHNANAAAMQIEVNHEKKQSQKKKTDLDNQDRNIALRGTSSHAVAL